LLGAIIGDIVGSRFEGSNHKGKDFELFDEECRATDDSVMTLAIAKAIMETEKIMNSEDDGMNDYYSLLEKMTVRCMQEIGRKYPYVGYGWWFSYWIFSDDPKPYNSFGNGAAMRISPVGHIAITESDVIKLSEVVTAVTHNHKEGIKGAEAVAMAIYMVRHGYTKEEIRQRIERDYYPLDFTIEGIKDTYLFDASCQNTVPQAIVAFLESVSFEDAIRNAVSIGGDSDTIAAITGSIAEAYYTVPEDLKEKALTYLDDELYSIYD
jgi:ADP-ribosyl-[dinitrogen reductase] hydrolase